MRLSRMHTIQPRGSQQSLLHLNEVYCIIYAFRNLDSATSHHKQVLNSVVIVLQDCDQPDYKKLVEALCHEHNVNLLAVPKAKELGEWAGLCKIDSEGKARKVVGCSCVVIKDYGEETEGLNVLQEYVKNL